MMTRDRSLRAIDQMANSASSALYSLGLVAVTNDAELGAVAIAMTAQALLLGFTRTAVSEAILLRADDHERRGLAWLPMLAGAAAGVLAGGATILIALLVGLTGGLAIALAAAAAGVMFADGCRFAAFVARQDALALRADILWLAVAGCGIAIDALTGGLEATELSYLYALGALVGVLSFAPLRSSIACASRPPKWLSHQFKFGADFLLQIAPGQAALVSAAAVTSFAAVGVLRAGVTLYNPLTTVVYAIRLTILDRPDQRPGRAATVYAATAVCYATLLTGTFAIFPSITERLFGPIATWVLVAIGLGEAGRHVTQAIVDDIRSRDQVGPVLFLRGQQATMLVAATVVLGAAFGLDGIIDARPIAFGLPLAYALVRQRASHRRQHHSIEK